MERKIVNNFIEKRLDEVRHRNDFLSIEDVLTLSERNTVFDPFSLLISKDVKIGEGNIFYPNVLLKIDELGSISIGDANVIYPGTVVTAAGSVTIGSSNTFGTGFVAVFAGQEQKIIFKNNGRFMNGVNVVGNCTLGEGSQVLGGVLTVQECTLGDGETFQASAPDERGAVLKGAGLARGIQLQRGEVIQAYGIFNISAKVMQSHFHKSI